MLTTAPTPILTETFVSLAALLCFSKENACKIMPLSISTDTWGQLVATTLNHKTCINTSKQVLEQTLFAINAIFTQDNNLSKPKVEGSLQKTNATCSKCKTNPILTYLHRFRRHSSSQSQKRESTILSGKLVGCFGFNGPLGQYFSLYRTVSQRMGERGEKE